MGELYGMGYDYFNNFIYKIKSDVVEEKTDEAEGKCGTNFFRKLKLASNKGQTPYFTEFYDESFLTDDHWTLLEL